MTRSTRTRGLARRPVMICLAAIDEKRRFVTAFDELARRAAMVSRPRRTGTAVAGRFADVEQALTAAAIPAEPGFTRLDATLRATFRYASRGWPWR